MNKKHLPAIFFIVVIALHVYLESPDFNKFLKKQPDHMVHVVTATGEMVIDPESIITVSQDTESTLIKIKTDKGENYLIAHETASSINNKIEKAKK